MKFGRSSGTVKLAPTTQTAVTRSVVIGVDDGSPEGAEACHRALAIAGRLGAARSTFALDGPSCNSRFAFFFSALVMSGHAPIPTDWGSTERVPTTSHRNVRELMRDARVSVICVPAAHSRVIRSARRAAHRPLVVVV